MIEGGRPCSQFFGAFHGLSAIFSVSGVEQPPAMPRITAMSKSQLIARFRFI
jgi:hypothetical protein